MRKNWGPVFLSLWLLVFAFCIRHEFVFSKPPRLDPAAWGNDHAGQPLPEFVTGDECLFCHRADVGPMWKKNRHFLSMREADGALGALVELRKTSGLQDFAEEVKLVLGGGRAQRFLKPSEEYGKLTMLSVAWSADAAKASGKLVNTEHVHWDTKVFANDCAGCHTSAFDVQTRAFASAQMDCFACHGAVSLEHSKDAKLVHLAKKRHNPAREVMSICAQCHVRNGHSRTTGRPYAANFVAGDNLFRDFQVDFSDDVIQKLNPADRHVVENVRDVVLYGKEEITCLSCHDVHKESSRKHRRVAESDSCLTCHNAAGSKKKRPAYEVHSRTCGY